jgi:hypothetical protein
VTALTAETGRVVEEGAGVPRQCPRCAYDLVGAITSWRGECPLRGTCSECGLEFAWRDIFDDRLSGPPWSFEHGARWSWRRLATTSWNAGLGWMWRDIRLEIPIVASRLVVLPLLVLLAFHLCVSLAAMVDAVANSRNLAYQGIEVVAINEGIPALLWPYGYDGTWVKGMAPLLVLGWVGMQWLFMPLMMLILGQTMRRVKVRRVHILRGACYSVMAAVYGAVLAIVCTAVVYLSSAVFRVLAPIAGAPMGITLALVPSVWLTLWWYRFIKLYLRLPRAGVVTAVMMGVTIFAAFTFMFWVVMLLD